jgi:SAM-dependent methyltransferase
MSDGAAAKRERGTVFGEVAELYDRVRPGYPVALVDEVLAFAPESPRVLEVGAGTGKATVSLAERGLDVLALEPSVEMAGVARRNCARFSGVTVDVQRFEGWPAEREAFQLVASAQAWHWVAAEIRYVKAREVLTSGGALTVFWNRPQWAAEIESSGCFGAVTRRSYRWSKRYTTREWLELLQTQSDHRMLAAEERAHLLDEISEVIDAAGGSMLMDYVTRLYLARRLD